MPKYIVPVTYEMQGCITVEADSPKEAIARAKKRYYNSDDPRSTIKLPSIETTFAFGDEESEVILEGADEG